MTPTFDTRETRGFASEIKFLVDRATGNRIRDWARATLDRDPHGVGPFGDEYRTTSLYFDTADFDVFHRRASYGRSKYRVRRYEPGSPSRTPARWGGGGEQVAFLERKLRRAARLAKRRTAIALHDLKRLNGSNGRWAGTWFERRILLRGLLPVCQISYDRLARVAMRETGPVRLTLDDDLHAIPRVHVGFAAGSSVPVLPGMMVLELKYRGAPPALFKQLVEQFTLTPARVSKYRMTMDALGLVPEEAAATPAPSAGIATYA